MRSKDIKESYTKVGGLWNDENKLFSIGDQMNYEWEQDFIAMKRAIEYLQKHLEYRQKNDSLKTFGDHNCNLALHELLKRACMYSCPSNLKDEFKTIEKCPLKENCKCCAVSDK
jgi:hypothetical protein